MTTVVQAANPLPFLLEEERHGDRQATEAILLTFNVDLGFFEARALGVCMSAGARVCVVADGSVWSPDPYAAKLAGRDYHVGLAVSPGAFHPKLIIVVGPKRALVAVGSGNLTMGGWQHNAETWTIFRANIDQAPEAMYSIADVLANISPGLDPIAADALTRATGELRGLLDRCTHVTDTGHQILTNTQEPIVAQLPEDGADEVWMYAPFHDSRGRGVAAVLQQLRPERATVMVQPHMTVVDPETLGQSLNHSGITWQVVADGDAAAGRQPIYRHGKLIEWTTRTGERFALTGSPNLSYSALAAPAGHGNTEVAIVSPITDTLFPPSTPLSMTEVPAVQIVAFSPGTASEQLGAMMLSAVLADNGIQLTLNKALSSPAVLELSLRHDNPDTWTQLGPVSTETKTPIISTTVPIPANSRVRLYDSTTGTHCPLLYVTEPSRVQRRVAAIASSRTARRTPADLWGDDLSIINALAADLADLASDVAATKAPPASTSGTERAEQTSNSAKDSDTAPWLWLKDQTATHHGPGLAAFALGMPAPPNASKGEELGWVDQLVKDNEIELDEDPAEDVEADESTPTDLSTTAATDQGWDHGDVRRERRRRIEKWADLVSAVPVASGLIVLRVALVWWSAGDWDEDDPQAHHLVSSILRKIAARDTGNLEELEARTASLGVVALTMLGDRIDPTTRNEITLAFHKARDELSYLSLNAEEDLVHAYSDVLRTPAGLPLDSERVMDKVRSWLAEDPLADAVEAVERAGHSVERVGASLLRIEGTFGTPEQVAVRAVNHVDDSKLPVGVWAISDRGSWAFVAWDRPNLIRVTKSVSGPMLWRHQQLPPILGPVSSRGSDGFHGLVRHGARINRFAAADDLLGKLGLESPTPD